MKKQDLEILSAEMSGILELSWWNKAPIPKEYDMNSQHLLERQIELKALCRSVRDKANRLSMEIK
ncbi:MAG: hypothetical protein PVG39_00695 [Desulfobacteraceae bacterium]|jgi:hypothetical protein